MRYLITLLSLSLIIIACNKESTAPDSTLILYDSFEVEGAGSYRNWTIEEGLTDFDNSTPADGGAVSLKLTADGDIEGCAVKEIVADHGDGIYEFSVWARMSANQPESTGYAIFGVSDDDGVIQEKTVMLTDTVWTCYTIVDTLTFEAGNYLYMKLSPGLPEGDNTWYSLFDVVRVEKAE